jgi:hypothetical protein
MVFDDMRSRPKFTLNAYIVGGRCNVAASYVPELVSYFVVFG